VKLLAQRQSRPNSKAKYLYGALGALDVLTVQNLLVCQHIFSIVATNDVAHALQPSCVRVVLRRFAGPLNKRLVWDLAS
jgi:hypothetical protein